MTSAPVPAHILRNHKAQINCVWFSPDNERLYSADLDGWVTVISIRTLRPLARWQPHTASVLNVQEWNLSILTHGRDHKLHVWSRLNQATNVVESVETMELDSKPPLQYSLDVNALNFCRFSLSTLPGDSEALLAVPNLVDSNYVDIWKLPQIDRVHAAIGKLHVQDAGIDNPNDHRNKLGTVMCIHIFQTPIEAEGSTKLHLLAGYEDGSVALYSRIDEDESKTIEGQGWDQLWICKEHKESIMGLGLAPDFSFAISVSADSLHVRYNIPAEATERMQVWKTRHVGHGSIDIRLDGRIFAVGGWDGKVRLFSAKTCKSLGTLSYHRGGCYAVSFAHPVSPSDIQPDEEYNSEELIARGLWLASGGKDSRVCIWPLLTFEKSKQK